MQIRKGAGATRASAVIKRKYGCYLPQTMAQGGWALTAHPWPTNNKGNPFLNKEGNNGRFAAVAFSSNILYIYWTGFLKTTAETQYSYSGSPIFYSVAATAIFSLSSPARNLHR